MAEITRAIRHKRFNFSKDSPVKFVIETKIGSQYTLIPENCSLTGIAGYASQPLSNDEQFDIGDILPAAKIIWEGHEYALGRLVIRNFVKKDEKTTLGFSLVDSKTPIDGPLARYLETPRDEAAVTPYGFELNPDKFSIANFTETNQTNVDLFAKCKQFSIYFNQWEKMPKYQYHTVRTPSMGARVNLTRSRPNGRNDYLVMGSNDYLGLASHPEVIAAARNAIDQYGFGSTGSPLTTGISAAHEELCGFLAKLYGKEKVILYNSGYTANVGFVQGITTAQDLIVADILAHASLQDGMRMSSATSRFFKHNDPKHLEKILSDQRNQYAGALVITEGIFSMDGDVPPLKKIVEIAKKYNARTFVDEAHSLGVIGPNGLGGCEKFGVISDVDVIMGTFSKICGGIGGFIAGNSDVMDWLYWLSRAHMFSVSIPPSTAAAALKALQIFTSDKTLLTNVRRNIRHFVNGLRSLGAPLNPEHESTVVPVVIGDEKKLGQMNQVLIDNGVFVVPIVFPAVSRKTCRFRFTVMATHTISDLDYALSIFEKAMQKADFTFKKNEEQKEALGATGEQGY
ncbi:MAG: aminotransferase class I/II-fold pyridoxal phosphate-dependent enzyme [Bdellovibrionota bacterium]